MLQAQPWHGTMAWWHDGMVTRWHGGTAAWWHSSMVYGLDFVVWLLQAPYSYWGSGGAEDGPGRGTRLGWLCWDREIPGGTQTANNPALKRAADASLTTLKSIRCKKHSALVFGVFCSFLLLSLINKDICMQIASWLLGSCSAAPGCPHLKLPRPCSRCPARHGTARVTLRGTAHQIGSPSAPPCIAVISWSHGHLQGWDMGQGRGEGAQGRDTALGKPPARGARGTACRCCASHVGSEILSCQTEKCL